MDYAMLRGGPSAFLQALDFAGLEARIAAQHHDEMVVEVKTVGYGMGKTHDDMLDAVKYSMGRLTEYGAAQAINRLPRHIHSMRFRGKCNPKQRLWAMAFQDVLGVGDAFYADANGMRKHYLEQHYTELAKHDTRKGRKAAKVVAQRVMYALEDEELPPKINAQGSMTGRMTMPSLNNIPKSKMADRIFGKKFDALIVDELTAWTSTTKKP